MVLVRWHHRPEPMESVSASRRMVNGSVRSLCCPAASASKAMKCAGICSASVLIRLSAGWMR